MAELTGIREPLKPAPTRPRVLRWLLIGLGSVCVALAAVGLFVPLIPTIDFLLLAALCYANSSPRAHRWLHTNRLFGKRLRDYRERRGATLATKAWTLLSLVVSLAATMYFVAPPAWVTAILLMIAAAVTIHVVRLTTVSD